MSVAVAPVPCPKCPFRKDVPIYLRAERREEIADALRDDSNFYCHQTTEHREDDDGDSDMHVTADSAICAGAAKAIMQAGGSTNLMRVTERLGLADLDKVEARGAEVWDLDQWPRLAEGSNGDKPVWEVGDEHGVNTCCVTNSGCEAPAGWLGAGGMVVRGTVEAYNECVGCGEFFCDNCASTDMEFCANCGDEDDEDY